MYCNTGLVGITKGCSTNNVGGITNFYIAPSEFLSASTVSAGTVTSITMSGSAKFVEYEFNKNSFVW